MKILELIPLKKPVTSSIFIPGSKSYTNRALILAAITKGKVKISNPLFSDDTKAMIGVLRKLGVRILIKKNVIEVIGSINDSKKKDFILDVNLSGTTLRFILPILTIIPGIKMLGGKEGLNKRPVKILVDALRTLGAKIEYIGEEGFPPLKITSSTLHSGEITLDGSVSSQYFSALLMMLPIIGNSTITIKGIQVSQPYSDMTLETMRKFGVEIRNGNHKKYAIPDKQNYKLKEYVVEGDFSSAGYFLGIAALTKSTIILKNLESHSLQADRKILDVLRQMGNNIVFGKNEIIIVGKGVKPISVNAIDFPDSVQTLAVLAAFAKGTTKISGIQSLRVKETNRVIALQQELKKMGIQTSSTRKTLTIHGGSPKAAIINTYNDHRMAMSFAIAATKLSGIRITDPDVVTKTFPNFWSELKKLGVKIEERSSNKQKIVLIGFMGSGKSSLAPVLAKRLGFMCIEMDDLVVERSKEKSVKEIFEKLGEPHFRSLEQQIAESLENEKNVVISAGGGVVMNKKIIESLAKNAIIIFLSTSFETIEKRLGNNSDRPLWKDNKKARLLSNLREPLYKQAADIVVSTENKALTKITDEIIEKMGGNL